MNYETGIFMTSITEDIIRVMQGFLQALPDIIVCVWMAICNV